MPVRRWLVIFVFAALFGGNALADTFTLVSAGGNWSNTSIWLQNAVPATRTPGSLSGTTDVVNITTAVYTVTVDLALAESVVLTTTCPSSTSTCVVDVAAAGTLKLALGSSIGSDAHLKINGGVVDGGTTNFLSAATLDFLSGTLQNGGVNISTGAFLKAAGPGTMTISNESMLLAGTWTYTAGQLDLNNAGSIIVQSGGVFDIQTISSIGTNDPTGTQITVNSGGTFKKTAGAFGTNVTPPLDNNGLVQVTTNKLVISNGVHTGTFDMAAGTEIGFAGTQQWQNGTVIQGSGEAQLGQVTVTGTVTATNLAMDSFATLGGTGTLDVSGLFRWRGGSISGLILNINSGAPGATLNVTGEANVTLDGNAHVNNNNTIEIDTGAGKLTLANAGHIHNFGTIKLDGDVEILSNNTLNPYIKNEDGSLMEKISGAGLAKILVNFDNSGTMQSSSGNVLFGNSGVHTGGTFSVCGSCYFDFAGGFHTFDTTQITGTSAATKLAGATISVAGASSIDTDFYQFVGTVTGAEVLTIGGNFYWHGGTQSGNGMTVLDGTTGLFAGTNGPMVLTGRKMTNNSALDYSPVTTNHLSIDNGAILENNATINLTTDAPINSDGLNGAAINNESGASFNKSGGAGLARIGCAFNNKAALIIIIARPPASHAVPVSGGLLNVTSGQVALNGGGTNQGTIFFPNAANAVVIESNTYTLDDGTTLDPADAGSFRIDGGTLDLSFTLPFIINNIELLAGTLRGSDLTINNSLKWKGGTILGPGNTTIASAATMDHLAPSLPTFLDNRTLHNNGTADYEGTGLQLLNNAVINNNTGASFNTRDGAILNGAGSNSFNNSAGTLKKISGATGMRFDVQVKNTLNGVISSEQSGQSLIFANGGSSDSGSLTTTAGALLDFFGGTFNVNGGSITGAGQTRVNGGTLKINLNLFATTTVAVLSGALDVSSPNTFQVNSLVWTGGTLQNAGTTRAFGGSIGNVAATTLSGDHTLTIAAGPFSYDANATNFLTINDTSNLNVESGSPFSITADSKIAGAATASVTNSGTLHKTGGGAVAEIIPPITSSLGSIGSLSGILRLSGGGTISTQIATAAGTTVQFANGSFLLNGGVSVSGTGTIGVNSGTVDISVPLSIPNFVIAGGTVNGNGNLTITNMQWLGGLFDGPGNATVNTLLTINGAFSLARAVTSNGTTNHQAGSIGGGTGGSFLNNGTYNLAAAPGTIGFAPSFTNAGTANIAGSIAFNGGYTQSAGTTDLTGGSMSSPSAININGGLLKGNGTITGNVANNATVAPGASPGLITIIGNYTQSPSGVLNIELGGLAAGTQYDQLAISGTATLGGTVNVSIIPPFVLTGGDVFDPVTYGSHTGVFATENLPAFPGGSFNSSYLANSYQLAAVGSTDVTVTKTGPANAQISDLVDYTITVTNVGPGVAGNVSVSDTTPSGLTFVGNSGACATPFPCSFGDMAAGEIKVITATYSVDPSAGGQTITNTATISTTTLETSTTNNSASATTTIGCPNVPPTGLQPVGTAPASGNLSWDAARADIYQVYFGPKGSGCSMPFGVTPGISIPYDGLLNDTEYEWRVESVFDGCPVQTSACVSFKTAACAPPPAPIARVIGEATSAKTYTVEWDAMSGVVEYEVDEATNAAFTDAVTFTVNGTSKTFNHEVSEPKAWWYRVRAIICGGVEGASSLPIRVVIIPLPSKAAKNPSINVPAGTTDAIVFQVLVPGEANQNLTYSAVADKPWFYVTPPVGPLPPTGATLDVVVPHPDELPNGTFTGTVLVTTTPAASNRVVSHGTTVSLPISINLVTPVTPVSSKPGASPYALVVPGVGHLPGIDSFWQSDLRLTNAGFRKYKYRLTFTPAGGTSGGVKQTDITVDAGATTALDDIVRNWFGFGSLSDAESGMLEIVPLEDPENASKVTIASSRTYNVTAAGTLGQFVPAVPFASFIGKAAQGGFPAILSLQQLSQSGAFRTNFGVAEAAGSAANVVISIFNAAGTKLLDIPQTLAAGQQVQLNALMAQHGLTLSDARAEVKVIDGGGKVTAYASVVDGATGDPLLVSGVPLTGTGATRFIMPGAANVNTGFANWRTDMRLFNFGTGPQEATFTFMPMGGGAETVKKLVANVGEVVNLDHVVKNFFGQENIGGMVHITTETPASFIVSARTYNQTADGTLGQFVPAVTVDQGVGRGGKTLHVLQVESSVRYRTNIGVYELTGKPATVEMQVVLPDSKVTPTVTVPLAAYEYKQFDPIKELSLGNIYNARVAIRLIDGDGKVMAYGSLIDETTQDPAYIPAQQ